MPECDRYLAKRDGIEEELMEELAWFRERVRQLKAAVMELSHVAALSDDASDDVLPSNCLWIKCAHGSRAACLRAWAGAPDTLTAPQVRPAPVTLDDLTESDMAQRG